MALKKQKLTSNFLYSQPTLNRTAVTIVPKQAFWDWVNSLYTDEKRTTENQVDKDTFLLDESIQENQVESFIKENYTAFFEYALIEWTEDEKDWIQERTYEKFLTFFDYSYSSILIDLKGSPLKREYQ